MTVADLPALNACLNGLSALLLTGGFVAIRRDRQDVHRRFMIAALCSSTLFLTGYLAYHFHVQTVTRFEEPAGFRPIYLVILLSHTLLAGLLLPLVLGTVWNALRGRFERHRRWARWTWPIWMYVSVTGVLIYLLLYQIFPQTAG
jgi:putative membrane protein